MCLTKAGKNGTTSSSDYIYKTQSPDYTKLKKEKKKNWGVSYKDIQFLVVCQRLYIATKNNCVFNVLIY